MSWFCTQPEQFTLANQLPILLTYKLQSESLIISLHFLRKL